MYAVFTMEQSFWLILLETPQLGFGDEKTSLSWTLVLLDWQLLWISPISLNSVFIDWEATLGWPSMGTIWMMCLLCSVQISLSVLSDSETPWITALQASLSITISRSSLKLRSIELVMPSSHLILCRPLLLLPPIPPSISLFQWVSSSHQVAKVLEFQLQLHSFQWTTRTDLL